MRLPRGISALGTLFFFIIFIVLLGILWVASGGPSNPLAHAGPFLKPPKAPSVNLHTGRTTGSSFEADEGTVEVPKTQSLLNYFLQNIRGTSVGVTPDSPYAADIELKVGNVRTSDPNMEYIVIKSSRKLAKNITMTGWTLQSQVNLIKASVSSAVAIPALGQLNSEGPVVLGPDTTLYVSTGRSPLGFSFRTNVCTGYFEQNQDFIPSLKRECPTPEDEALLKPEKVGTNAECIDFVESLRRCEIYTRPIEANIGASCREFVQNDLTYSGCTALHRNDPQFYKNEWRIFLSRQQGMWADQHDQIRLLDENGKLVAAVSY